MSKKTCSQYKESVVRTMWNVTAELIQEINDTEFPIQSCSAS